MDQKQELQRLISKLQTDKFQREQAGGLVKTIGEEIKTQLTPAFKSLGEELKSEMSSAFKDAVNSISIDAPEISIPSMEFPDIPTPIVNVPAPVVNVPAPIVNIPATQFPEYPTEVGLRPGDRPFPVTLMDPTGKPFSFSQSVGGGKADFLTIKDIQTSAGNSIIDNDGFVKVTGSFSVSASNASTQVIDSSGLPYNASNPFPVTFTGSSSTSVSFVNSDGTYYNSDNPLPVTFSSSVQPVSQVSGNVWSTYVNNPVDNGDSATALRVVIAGNSAASVTATQSGTWNITTLTGITNTVGVNLSDSSGVGYSGSNPVPISGAVTQSGTWNVGTVTTVTGITNSVGVANIDSSGVQYSGSNPFPFTLVTSATATMNVALTDSGGIQYSGSNPVPITVVSGSTSSSNLVYTRQTNPTAVAADYVRQAADDLGRTITRPIQVRDLIATAYVTLSTGTEATLLAAGGAGVYHDLISIIASNTSSAAQQLDIRAVTGGNIVQTLYIPANATTGWTPPVPWPQDATNNNWTVDMADVTNSNIIVSALFTKEI